MGSPSVVTVGSHNLRSSSPVNVSSGLPYTAMSPLHKHLRRVRPVARRCTSPEGMAPPVRETATVGLQDGDGVCFWRP